MRTCLQRSRASVRIALLALTTSCSALPATGLAAEPDAALPAPSTYQPWRSGPRPDRGHEARFNAERVVAFGDVHGDYAALTRLLQAANVIDGDLNWTAAETHLVSVGDLLDRGPGSIAVLDLMMRLQEEAAAAGGRVHLVLGNHELMNLIGDLRYIPASEYAAFASEDVPVPPDRPPGYVERYEAFTPNGVYGRWLLTQPAAVIINDTLFVHGGLPPGASALGLEGLNRTVAARLDELLALRTALEAANLIAPHGDVQANALALQAARATQSAQAPSPSPAGEDTSGLLPPAFGPLPAELETQVVRFVELAEDPLFGDGGVMWYRGTALCHDLLERPIVETGLGQMQAARVVVGHTPTWDSRVRARFDGLAILADTGMLQTYYRGQPSALIVEGDRIRVLYADTGELAEAPDPRAGLEFAGVRAAEIERVLAEGVLTLLAAVAADDAPEPGSDLAETAPAARLEATPPPGTTLVTAVQGDLQVTGLFEPGSKADIERQLAAYRLDQMLDLGLVAPVATRELDGRRGIVSARWPHTLDEQARAAGSLPRQNWCARGSDFQIMYVFDALIRNMGRNANTMLYDRRTWQLASAGHADSFGRGRDLPPYLANAPKLVPVGLATALQRLDEVSLERELGELLTRPQRRALLQRRDDLLANWTVVEAAP